jgi:hypothetical protein
MKLPFTQSEFYQVFIDYNRAIWPTQILALIIAFTLIATVFLRRGASSRNVLFSLAAFWFMTGMSYHYYFFPKVNPMAYAFAAIFVIQAIYLVVSGIRYKGTFHVSNSPESYAGLALILYAAVIYPLIGAAQGRIYPLSPVLGVAPCPTTIFTIGFMLLAKPRLSLGLYLIPITWGLVGTFAALNLGMPEDFGLLGSVITVLLLKLSHRMRSTREIGLGRAHSHGG